MSRIEYEKLLTDIKENDFYQDIDLTNRINCYYCENCNHITKTKDVDKGVTPFFHKCEKCGKNAKSSFYEDIVPLQKPTQEWYRPDYNEFKNISEFLKDHVLQGGLLPRSIK